MSWNKVKCKIDFGYLRLSYSIFFEFSLLSKSIFHICQIGSILVHQTFSILAVVKQYSSRDQCG